jgi:hypothetical protein
MRILAPTAALFVLIGPTLAKNLDLTEYHAAPKNPQIREGEPCNHPGQQRCLSKIPSICIYFPLCFALFKSDSY